MHLAVVLLTLLFCVLEAVPIATSTSLSTKDRVYLPSPRRQGLNPAIPHRAKSSLATYLLASTQTIQSIPTTSTTFQAPQTTPFVAASITQSPIKATSTEVANTPTATSGGVVGSWSSSGNYKARTIAYSPFHNDGSCKSTDEVLSDIAFLKNKGFYSVRTYDTGCGTLQNVGQAVSANGMKIIVGLWMDSAASVDPQVQAFISWGQGNKNYDLVDMLMIGNEVLYSNRDTAVNLIAKIKSVRSQVVAAGYTGPIGTADTVQSYLQNPGLCASGVLDVVGLNAHPYFDADPSKSAADDGALVQSYVNQVSAACANKNIFVTETGFPNHGNTNGGMVPSYANQKIAIESVLSVMGPNVCLFTTFEDLWKQPGQYNVEQSWGMFDLTTPSNDVW